jgi:hypothetical protein
VHRAEGAGREPDHEHHGSGNDNHPHLHLLLILSIVLNNTHHQLAAIQRCPADFLYYLHKHTVSISLWKKMQERAFINRNQWETFLVVSQKLRNFARDLRTRISKSTQK